MSDIDQAFIQAYTSDSPRTLPDGQGTSGTQSPMRFDPQSGYADSSVGHNTTHDPIPNPHFAASPAADARNQTALLQKESLRLDGTSSGVPHTAATPSEQRQPLSSFSGPTSLPTPSFRPVFEVDQFCWTQVTSDLLQQHGSLLVPVAEQLLSSCEDGRSLVGVAGARHSVGTTTVAMCLARLLAAADKSIALVDADFFSGSLGSTLGLDFDTGWEDVLSGRFPLAESMVHSLNDNIAVLPVAKRGGQAIELLDGIQTSITAGVLRYHYDLVIFDLGSASQQPQFEAARKVLEHCRLDASIIVADTAEANDFAVTSMNQLLALLGPTCLGVVGNDSMH